MLKLIDFQPKPSHFREEVLEGLTQASKKVSPKFLYDEKGSELFEKICSLREYYPTRTEIALLHEHAGELAQALGPHCALIEYGSGASIKTQILLDRLEQPGAYVPVDISRGFLLDSARSLSTKYPKLPILPVCADYTQPMKIDLEEVKAESRAVFFPGSTIGNLDPQEAEKFLSQTRELLGPEGKLIIGVDTVKDRETLEAAYDDSAGVTAAFNLNLLARINRELGGGFDLSTFRHRAHFNDELSRIEMHLLSMRRQDVPVADHRIPFESCETIHTESSYKYEPKRFIDLAERAGLSLDRFWMDADGLFAVYLLQAGRSELALAA